MSADTELIELAARAAGLKEAGWMGGTYAHVVNNTWAFFDPLNDDGDALRLAVKLRINIEHQTTMGGKPVGFNVWPVGRGDCAAAEDGNDLADLRRAIVRAAAEIGRGSPMTDQTTHQQESAVLISASWDQAADGSYTATVRVSGLASEEQAKGDVRRMREALSAPGEQALPELPRERFHAWLQNGEPVNAFNCPMGDPLHWDRDGYWSEKGFARAPLFTADQMRAYAAEAVRAASSSQPLSEERIREGFRANDEAWPFKDMTAWQVWNRAVQWVARAYRAAQGNYPAAPDGWKLVPIEPTLEMMEAAQGGAVFDFRTQGLYRKGLLAIWNSMLSAAPSPGAEGTIKQDLRVGGPT